MRRTNQRFHTKPSEEPKPDNENEDIATRFPNVERDTRLQTTQTPLPDAPEVTFERPKIKSVTVDGQQTGMAGRGGSPVRDARGIGIAMAIGTSLFGSILGGIVLGWAVDKYVLGNPTTPWGLICGFLLGTIAAVSSVMQLLKKLNQDEK